MACLRVSIAAALLALASTCVGAAPVASNGVPISAYLIGETFPPIPPAQQALTGVTFAPGAPAVVLVQAQQTQWADKFSRQRTFRRVKILTDAGAHAHGNYAASWWGDAKLASVSARTVLPDGTIVDAKDSIHVETSKDPDSTRITVAFPRVQVGAILDVLFERRADYIFVDEWIIQEEIPVLESRLLLTPPVGLRFRPALVRVVEEKAERTEFDLANERMYAWIFHDSPALPDVPNRPPAQDISARLLLISDGYRFGKVPYGAGWTEVIDAYRKYYDEWLHGKHAGIDALARQVTTGAATPRAKAEAIRVALRDRMAVPLLATWLLAASPDAALASGKGNSADVALLEIAALRAVGVDAHAAGLRRRSSGAVPVGAPAPNLLDDLLVVVPAGGDGGRDLVFSPIADQPVDLPDPERAGVQAVPYRKGATQPFWIPDIDASQNGITRDASLVLGSDGALSGKVTCSARGFEAARWRRELAARTEDQRKTWIEDQLAEHLPSLRVDRLGVASLEDAAKPLVIDVDITSDAGATRAGGRLLVNPLFFRRISAGVWAAEERDVDVDLGRPRESLDTLRIEMPTGVASVVPPAPLELGGGDVGAYAVDYKLEGTTLRVSRRLRLSQAQVEAASYRPLRDWFRSIADADDRAVVITMTQP